MGLKYALEYDFDYVYLLNQDAWVQSNTFENLITISRDNPEFGLISPIQMNADLYHIDKNFCVGLFKYQNKNFINDLYNETLNDIYETTPFVMAAHWFLTKSCIKKVGGFSPTFTHYGEDRNYADRIKYHGFKIGIAPKIKVVHDRGERSDPPKKIMKLNYISLLVRCSDPVFSWSMFGKSLAISLYNGAKFYSLIPVFNFFKFLFNYFTIRRNKKISIKSECAFLS